MDKYTHNIRKLGDKLIQNYIKGNGKINAGINGPYDDPETKVRNLTHLIIITAIEILKFNENKHFNALLIMGNELINLKSNDGTYIMRNKAGKDSCNGVIGHAWVIEAYVYLFKVFKKEKYIREAEQLCEKHYFDDKLCLWERPINAKYENSIDFTLNHQLWYAASLAELNFFLNNPIYEKQLNEFMNNLPVNMSIGRYGKISHSIYRRIDKLNLVKNFIKKHINYLNESLNMPSFEYKEQGYHVFNLMALARIYQFFPNHYFFISKKFKKAVKYCNSTHLLMGLKNKKINLDKSFHNNIIDHKEKEINIYGYPYNVPGFEMMYCGVIFADLLDMQIVNEVMKEQFLLTFNQNTGEFGLKCHDKNTINYRIYEFYRYLEIKN